MWQALLLFKYQSDFCVNKFIFFIKKLIRFLIKNTKYGIKFTNQQLYIDKSIHNHVFLAIFL